MIDVMRYKNCDQEALGNLLGAIGLEVKLVGAGDEIPGSFWGDDEAGLIHSVIYLRPDTPVHSSLHEACHYACMDDERRANLHTNAGGSSDEENAVCYLQILLADALSDMGRQRMFRDMDLWGYSFRLGSAQQWFEQDAEDARQWLEKKGLLDFANQLTHTNSTTFR